MTGLFPLPSWSLTMRVLTAALSILLTTACTAADPVLPWSGDFRDASHPDHPHRPAWDDATGSGFLVQGPDATACRFDLRVPPGNWHVAVTLRGADQAQPVTIMAEARRLMVHACMIPAGGESTLGFIVNTRSARIDDATAVKLNERERTAEAITWDDRLTLHILGRDPRIAGGCAIAAITVRAAEVPTIFIAGDSTVCDQPNEPYASWGQMLPRFIGPGAAVANHAQSGTSVASSLAQNRFAKILSLMRPGDHLLIQFGHNDMKSKQPDALATYREDLTRLIAQVQAKGGSTTLVTSMERHRFEGGRNADTLAGYPQAMREVAAANHIPCIDLHTLSRTLHDALGAEQAAALFAHPSEAKTFDHTHHGPVGAWVMARCVVHGLHQLRHPLMPLLATDLPAFDPARPDLAAIPAFPTTTSPAGAKPFGE